jgi:hypothetical protein
MSQTIQDFYTVAAERDFARDFMLRIRAIGDTRFNEKDFVYIKTAVLPSRSIYNNQVPYMGLNFNVPGTVNYEGSDAWTVKFHADQKSLIRSRLEAWQREIFDDATSTGDLSVKGIDRVIQLDLVDDQLNVLNTYNLYGVYIQKLGDVNYDIQGTGKTLDFDAVLAYNFWRHTKIATE